MSIRKISAVATGLTSTLLVVMVFGGASAQTGSGVQSGIDELATQIVARSTSADKTTIAISSFPHVDDSCSELSNVLVDELVLSLFSIPDSRLSIIERSQLGRIFAELELSLSGAVDVNTTRELGRLHGVETLLIGSLTTVGDDLRVNARLIDTETGQVFSAAAVNIPKTSTIKDLMQRPAAGGCTMTPKVGGSAPASLGVPTEAWFKPGAVFQGHGSQTDGSSWSIEIEVDELHEAEIRYDSIPCSGRLSMTSDNDLIIEFMERITIGQDLCVDGGTVVLERQSANLISYEWHGNGSSAFGTLTPNSRR